MNIGSIAESDLQKTHSTDSKSVEVPEIALLDMTEETPGVPAL
jgi:hypothetical protein